jgi:L-lactate dehydrogenase complex protein LldG
MPSTEMASFDVGITAADCLVARTGSVVLRCTSTGGRRLSVLPAHHIVLARKEQLVASLEDALPSIQKDTDWSFATLITGPSRTADIEKILVLGAHGPKRLTVILIG